MSLFIGGLALEGLLLKAGKIGTFAGSFISAVLGFTILFAVLPKLTENDSPSFSPCDEEQNSGLK